MHLTSLFHRGPTTVPSFSYWQARRCCTCHLIWDGQRSLHCPQGHAASIALPELLRQKSEQIVKLQGMMRKLLRLCGMKDLIIKAASRGQTRTVRNSRELSGTVEEPPPAA